MGIPLSPSDMSSAAPPGLSLAEAARRFAQYGPNAVAEDHVGAVRRILRHFWTPVPWMLEATIALQLAIGERVEALMVATLLMRRSTCLSNAYHSRCGSNAMAFGPRSRPPP